MQTVAERQPNPAECEIERAQSTSWPGVPNGSIGFALASPHPVTHPLSGLSVRMAGVWVKGLTAERRPDHMCRSSGEGRMQIAEMPCQFVFEDCLAAKTVKILE